MLNIPTEQALGLAELIPARAYPGGHVLVTVGDGGLAAAPLVVAFTHGDTNLATFEVNVAGTAEEV